MRIVHLQHPFLPDQGYQENYLPKHQQALGHDVYVLTTDVLPPKFDDLDADASEFEPGWHTYDGVPTYRLKSYSADGDMTTYSPGVKRLVDRLEPDVIHSHRLVSLHTVQALASTTATSKLFFDLHVDNDNFHLDSTYKRLGYATFERAVLPFARRRADGFIAVNPHARDFLADLGLSESEIELVPLGVDTDSFYRSESERASTRAELGVGDDELLLISAGNLTPNKDLDVLLEAVEHLVSADHPVKLLLLGRGPEEYMAQLRETVEESGLDDAVVFHDFVPHSELSRFYNAADVGVWPGKLGITIVEAIGCGLPSVVCDSRATAFLLANDNGLSFPRGDAAELARRLETYLRDDDLRGRHATNAVERVRNELAWREVAKRSLEVYRGS